MLNLPFMPQNADFLNSGILLIVFGAVLASLRNVPGKLWRIIERCFILRIEINEGDESFYWLKIWLSHKLNDSLSVCVYTRYRDKKPDYFDDDEESGKKKAGPDIFFAPAPGYYWSHYNGYFMTVSAEKSDNANASATSTETKKTNQESYTIRLYTRNKDLAKQLVTEARDFALPQDEKVEIYIAPRNYWQMADRARPRSLDSVILDDNIIESLIFDIEKFIKNADWYNNLGIPYRRGYLLFGPPGNGKSSTVAAIASHMKMNIHLLSLSSFAITDSSLSELLSNVSTNSLVLIEDVDCAFVQRESGKDRKESSGLSFSGILNALDGVAAKEGRIIFMTTNHIEKLDAALIRPGRVDVRYFIGNAKKSQARKLFQRFYAQANPEYVEQFAEYVGDEKFNMASLQGHLLKYQESQENSIKHLEEMK